MAQRESKRSREIMKALRLEGWFAMKIHGNEYTMKGAPDVVVCAEGYFIGLETKHPETVGDVSPRQEYVHGLIMDAGGHAEVAVTSKQAVAVVRRVLAERRKS